MSDIDERKIVEQATKGPWELNEKYEQVWSPSTGNYISACDMEHYAKSADATFIAHFDPKRVGEMLDEVDRLKSTGLYNELKKSCKENQRLRTALLALKIGDCWCNGTVVDATHFLDKHSDACKQAQELQ